MPSNTLRLRDDLESDALRPVIYQALALAGMLLVLGLSTHLPGVGRTAPGLAVTIRELVIATGAAAVVVWLAHSIPAVATFARSGLEGPDELVADAGQIAGALVAFLAVLVAYRGFAGVLIPAFGAHDAVWAYDVAFLTVGLGPIVVIADRVRRNLDVVADLITAAVTDAETRSVGGDSSEAA